MPTRNTGNPADLVSSYAINTATAAGITEAIGWVSVDHFLKEQQADTSNTNEKTDNSTKKDSDSSKNTDGKNPSEVSESKTDLEKELHRRADAFFKGEKTYEANNDELQQLLTEFDGALPNYPNDNPLYADYDRLTHLAWA